MVRVLIIKTSSLGDIIHTLPALSDAIKIFPDVEFDWVVEESFQEIPRFHPAVKKVIPVNLRRWRKNLLAGFFKGELYETYKALREIRSVPYDKIIDAQGLLKSAVLALCGRGSRAGFGRGSTRDALAPFFYKDHIQAPWSLHAVSRLRKLFAESLGYREPKGAADYGISPNITVHPAPSLSLTMAVPYLVFLHGTSWPSKHWEENEWQELIGLASNAGCQICLLWGSTQEKARALQLKTHFPAIRVEDKLSLKGIVEVLSRAEGVVSLDTGLGHLAAALNIPTVSLYGPTDPKKTGTFGKYQVHLSSNLPCAPCFERNCHFKGYLGPNSACLKQISPKTVFQALLSVIQEAKPEAIIQAPKPLENCLE